MKKTIQMKSKSPKQNTGTHQILNKIESVSLVDQVEESLINYFKENNFRKGDMLPKELELVEYLGVSRNILREALSRLRMLGVVVSKKRKGMVYNEPDILGGVEKIMHPDLLGNSAMKDIFELRLVLEIGMADLLFARLREEDINKLQDIAEREANDPACVEIATRLQYEIEFHGQLYAMTQNATMMRFQQMLLPVFNYMMEVESHLEAKPEKGNVSHFDIIKVLKDGDPKQFRESIREHLKPHFQRLND